MILSTYLKLSDPFIKRFWGWMEERFALPNWVLFFFLFFTALLFGRFLAAPGPLSVYPTDLIGYLAVWSFFLLLRIFDEHKDFELDCRLHPERVLQRGLIRLSHLKLVGFLAIGCQFAACLWYDRSLGWVTSLWVVVLGWSLLMAKEFFVGPWLKQHLVIYAISHMVIMPMAMIWMVQMGFLAPRPDGAVLWLAVFAFLTGAAFEVTRKTWGPEEEREGQDSYARIFGIQGAPLVVLVFVVASAGCQWLLLQQAIQTSTRIFYLLVIANLLLPTWSLLRFRRAPSAEARKRNEGAVGLALIVGLLILIAAMGTQRGLVWTMPGN